MYRYTNVCVWTTVSEWQVCWQHLSFTHISVDSHQTFKSGKIQIFKKNKNKSKPWYAFIDGSKKDSHSPPG